MRTRKHIFSFLSLLFLFLSCFLFPQTIKAVQQPCDVLIKATARITNGTGGESFQLRMSTDTGAPLPETTMLTVAAGESALFGPFTYEEPGKYQYVITQIPGEDKGIVYDGSIYHADVYVYFTDDKAEKLVYTTVSYKENEDIKQDIVFENERHIEETESEIIPKESETNPPESETIPPETEINPPESESDSERQSEHESESEGGGQKESESEKIPPKESESETQKIPEKNITEKPTESGNNGVPSKSIGGTGGNGGSGPKGSGYTQTGDLSNNIYYIAFGTALILVLIGLYLFGRKKKK